MTANVPSNSAACLLPASYQTFAHAHARKRSDSSYEHTHSLTRTLTQRPDGNDRTCAAVGANGYEARTGRVTAHTRSRVAGVAQPNPTSVGSVMCAAQPCASADGVATAAAVQRTHSPARPGNSSGRCCHGRSGRSTCAAERREYPRSTHSLRRGGPCTSCRPCGA